MFNIHCIFVVKGLIVCLIVPKGAVTKISLTPRLVSADESVKTLQPGQRNCKFSHETEDLVFLKQYSKAGCQFECKLQYAKKTCGCTPWDYPHVAGNGTKPCLMFGSEQQFSKRTVDECQNGKRFCAQNRRSSFGKFERYHANILAFLTFIYCTYN